VAPLTTKTLDSALNAPRRSSTPPRAAESPWFYRAAGACALVVVAIFLFQEVALRFAPGPGTTDEWLAGPLSSVEEVRMGLMFALFFFSLAAYAGLTFRVGNEAARAGLFFGTIACVIELGYRAVEMRAVPDWAEAYRHTQDPAVRALLRARIDAFQDVTLSLYSVIRGAALCTNACFAAALWRGAGLERAVGFLFLANAARLWLHYSKPMVPALGSVLDATFILFLAPLYACLGVWLWRPSQRASR
jgi:hypothetical protein